jgi:hypothetical protein
VSSYDDTPFDPSEAPAEEPVRRSRLPGGISVQTAAAGLIILVVVGLLWLLTLPEPSPPAAVMPPTAALSTSTAYSYPVTITQAAALGGTAVVGAAAATQGGAGGALVAMGTPVATLAPVALATGAQGTTGALVEGTFVRITGTGIEGIRFRFGPGLNYATIRIAEDGEDMLVLGGPEQGDGYDWWRLQDALGNVGWAAREYLQAVAAPQSWNPPAASPTYEAGAEEQPLLAATDETP